MGLLEKDKRKFTVVIGSKKCGVCCGTGPSLAAKKVKGKSSAFYLKETTKGSKKKLYGPYSSKKKVVQKGGTLRENICENVLKILEQCGKEQEFEREMKKINVEYGILENTYLCLGINEKKNKCFVLSKILQIRRAYVISNHSDLKLLDCLCSTQPNYNLEKMFIHQCKDQLFKILYYVTMTEYYTNFYSNWEKLINFLRETIRKIETKTLEKNKKNMNNLRNEFGNKPNLNLNRLKAQLEEARNLFAQGGPAEKQLPTNVTNEQLPTNVTNVTNEELLNLMFGNNQLGTKKPTPSYLIPNNNLEARLAALKNN